MAKRSVRGIPLIEKQTEPDECPRGGLHEDLPWVQELQVGDGGDTLRVFYCLKCRLLHWAVFPKDGPPKPAEPQADEDPLFDGVVHAS